MKDRKRTKIRFSAVKYIFAILTLACMSNILLAQNARIDGVIKECEIDSIYLADPYGEDYFGAEIKEDGSFSFEFENKNKRMLHLGFHMQNYIEIIVSPNEEISVKLDASLGEAPEVEGSVETLFLYEEIDKLKNMYGFYYGLKAIADSVYEAYLMGEEAEFKLSPSTYVEYELDSQLIYSRFSEAVDKKISEYEKQIENTVEEAVESHIDYLASVFLIQILEYEKNTELYAKLDAALKKKYPNDGLVEQFHKQVKEKSAFAIGSEAPDIVQTGLKGKEISLSSHRGKVVLIDFWASWCGPCIGEIPNLQSAYKSYKNKGFEIFSVSLDDNKEKWANTVKQKGMPWVHVSDLKGWRNEAALAYGVEGIPFTLLIDAEGKIIAKNLRGSALEEKLKEVFED